MTIYRVASTGSNTSPYDTWAKAATALATALAIATATGDVIYIDNAAVPAADKEAAADVTPTFAGNIAVICGTQSGAAGITPADMATGTWIGNSTTNRTVVLAGNFRCFIYGLTIRTAGSTNDVIALGGASGDNIHYELEECYIWNGNSNANSFIRLGASGGASTQSYIKCTNTTFRLGGVAQSIRISSNCELIGCVLASAGTAPTTAIFLGSDTTDPGGALMVAMGCDFSHAGSCPLVGSIVGPAQLFKFAQCKLGASYTMMATQTVTNKSSAQVWVNDCASGDTHGLMGYADAFGSVVSDTGIYFTAGAAAQSWKIVTTANASFYTPFVTPWIAGYNGTVGSGLGMYFEIARDGSTTAYQDDEVWAEVARKTSSGSTRATFANDRMTLAATPANQAAGAGTGSWTGLSGTAWSGKLVPPSQTPEEVGDASGRIYAGEPSITVYVNPEWLT